MNLKAAVAAVAVTAIALSPAGATAAGGAGGISVSPQQNSGGVFSSVAFFDLPTQPGVETVAGRLAIRNLERRPLTVKLEPVDALTASNLGYAYTVAGAASHGHTGWLRTSTENLVLASGETAHVSVTARPAQDAQPGDYLSGISVETAGQRTAPDAKAGVAVSSSKRYVVGVQMRVPGARTARIELPDAAVEGLPAGVTFLLSARNSGNLTLRNVRGRISAYRGTRRIATAPVGPGTFVMGTSVDLALRAPRERPEAGAKYRVTAQLRYHGESVSIDREVVFDDEDERGQESFGRPAEPSADDQASLLLVLLGIAGAMAGIAGAAVARRRYRRNRASLARLKLLEEAARSEG